MIKNRKSPRKILNMTIHNFLLLVLAIVWLIPMIWLVANSFSTETGLNYTTFFPDKWTFNNYYRLFFETDSVANFPAWFKNTLIVAILSSIISSFFVLMVAYAFSRNRFKARKPMMNVSVILGLFPGILSMIAIYFILKNIGLLDSLAALVIVYSAGSGLGYLVAKGFFDTIPKSLDEAATIDGATQWDIFWKIILPLSKPIIVYTTLLSFIAPWVDFIFARIIMASNDSTKYTVAIGLFSMLDRGLISTYFSLFCAGAVVVSIPIALLFIIMQNFYVEGVTGGSVKG